MNNEVFNLLPLIKNIEFHKSVSYFNANNPKKSFGWLLKFLLDNGEHRPTLHKFFIHLMTQFTRELYEVERCLSLKWVFEQSLRVYPEDSLIWNDFGVFNKRINNLNDSLDCFDKAINLNHKNLSAFKNACHITSELVARWHFGMLNNIARNAAYRSAIQNAILTKNFENVLDIGTGTGLLSIYAHEAGAKTIVACEESSVMHAIAANVFRDNQLSNDIQLIGKSSLDLISDLDFRESNRFDLIVTEILDSGVFGEGILETLIHAKRNLLSDTGLILPKTVIIFVCGYSSDNLSSSKVLFNDTRFVDCCLNFDKVKIVGRTDPYWVENLSIIGDFKIVTSIEQGMVVNFNDFEQIVGLLNGDFSRQVGFTCDNVETIDGFAVWFQLDVDEHNSITTHPSPNNCWDQGLFKFNQRRTFMKNENIFIKMSAKDGLLSIDHDYNLNGNEIFEVHPDIIKYLNDVEYLSQLENAFFKEYPSREFDKVLDDSQFPYMSLKLLISNRIKNLYLPIAVEPILSRTFEHENQNRITYFDKFPIEINFDLVFLTPILSLGDLNSEQILDYSVMKLNESIAGNSTSIVVPYQIRLHCELIRSKWLKDITRITNPEITQLNIAQQIDRYKTHHQLEIINNVDYEVISDLITVGVIEYDDQFYEKEFFVNLKNGFSSRDIDGILYQFQFKFTEHSEFNLPTQRDSCFVTRAAFINYNILETEHSMNTVKMRFIQNSGVIKCELV